MFGKLTAVPRYGVNRAGQFRPLVLARIIEPASKLGSLRVAYDWRRGLRCGRSAVLSQPPDELGTALAHPPSDV
jgi:hypothetical protein